jgi:organic radical activating enzyme
MSAVFNCTSLDVGLHLGVDNQIKTCCAGDDLGSITENTVNEIFSSERYLDIKNTLNQRKIPNYCRRCDKNEQDIPGSSQANYFKKFSTDGTRKIKQLDLRWNNTCNLSCRYCHPRDSSSWQQLKNIPLTTVNKEYYQSIFDEVEKNIDNIEEVSLIGGEPLLLKQNEQLLSMLPDSVEISLISNLSNKLENNKIYNLLKQRSNVRWKISFDNIEDRFEYVRHGAKWEILLHNLSLLKQDFNNNNDNNISIIAVYGIWSSTYANKLINFANEQNINIVWQLAFNTHFFKNESPGIFSIFDHDYRIRILALEEAKRTLNFIENKTDIKFKRNIKWNVNFFNGAINTLEKSLTEDNKLISSPTSKIFLQWLEENEKLMPPKKNFEELWPELYHIMINN